MVEKENNQQFEQRKRDHIALSLSEANQALGASGFNYIHLEHEPFPEINFSDISIKQNSLGLDLSTPFLVSSMTAGHVDSVNLNQLLAKSCEAKGWLMGVGSQRKELFDDNAKKEWKEVRKIAPHVKLLGNIGLSQLIETPVEKIQELVDVLNATAFFVHTNPLQEVIQPEGTPQFKGGLVAIAKLAKKLSVPVVVKETGCGFSKSSLQRLNETGVAAVDVSGLGGTHWGRIEGGRANCYRKTVAQIFADWGESTVDSLMFSKQVSPAYEVWASGGVRSGLDAAKSIALGAKIVGFAKPILEAALDGEESLIDLMTRYEYELKTAMFCSGVSDLSALNETRVRCYGDS